MPGSSALEHLVRAGGAQPLARRSAPSASGSPASSRQLVAHPGASRRRARRTRAASSRPSPRCARARRPACAQSASSARTSARSAASAAACRASSSAAAAPARRRRRRARSIASVPWPAAGTIASSSAPVASACAPEPLAARRARGRSRRGRPRASRRSRVSTLPRSSTTSRSGAQRAQLRARGAATLVPTRAPAASASSDARAAQRVARVGARRRGDDRRARRRAAPGRPWPSARRGRPRRAAARRRARLTQRSLSRRRGPRSPVVVIGTSSAPPSASATARAWASASALPRVPTLTTRRRGAAGARRPARPVGSASARRRGLVGPSRPNSSRSDREPSVAAGASRALFRRIVGSCSRRCITARAIASTRARSRGDSALPAAGVLGQDLLDDRLRRARAARRSSASTSSWPIQRGEALDLVLDDRLGARRARPRGPRGCARRRACRSSMS